MLIYIDLYLFSVDVEIGSIIVKSRLLFMMSRDITAL